MMNLRQLLMKSSLLKTREEAVVLIRQLVEAAQTATLVESWDDGVNVDIVFSQIPGQADQPMQLEEAERHLDVAIRAIFLGLTGAEIPTNVDCVDFINASAGLEVPEIAEPSGSAIPAHSLSADLFYIQNRGFQGNCLIFWAEGGHGYTCDLNEAWKVSKEEAERICKSRPQEDKPWPVQTLDQIAARHVNVEKSSLLKTREEAIP